MRVFEAISQFLKRHQLVIHTVGLTTAVSVQLAQAFKLPGYSTNTTILEAAADICRVAV